MKKPVLYALLCLALTACPYAPQLTEAPKDMSKYEADKAYCIEEGRARKNKSAFLESDAWKTPVYMANQCMRSKGYKLIP